MRRCTRKFRSGEPCRREAAPNSDTCADCAEESARNKSHKSASMYDLTIGREMHDALRSHKDVLSLEDEVALLRQLVARRWDAVEDEHDLAIKATPISDLLVRVKDTVVAANSVKLKRGELLDAHRVAVLAEKMTDAVNKGVLEHVNDEAVSGAILTTVKNYFLEILKEETQ